MRIAKHKHKRRTLYLLYVGKLPEYMRAIYKLVVRTERVMVVKEMRGKRYV